MAATLEQVKEQTEIVAEAAPAHVVELKEDPSVLDDLFGDAPAANPPAAPAAVEIPAVSSEADETFRIPQPDAKGEFATPAEGAKFMAAMGIPQIPLRGKAPFMTGWTDKGTLDFAQIDAWYAELKCNFGSVAKKTLDGHFALEVDSVDVRATFQKETEPILTSSLIVQSGPGRGHRWYKYSEASLDLLNIGQEDAAGFSLRVHNEQCVSPGSIHPERKTQYAVIRGDVPTPPSAEEIGWFKSKKSLIKDIKKAHVEHGKRVLIRHGAMYDAIISQCGRLWQQGFNPADIPDMLVSWTHENCEPPIDETKVPSYARGSNWKQGEPGAEWVYCGSYDETALEVEEPELPPFPRFSGLLTELVDAICPDIPYEFKVVAAITHWGLLRSDIDKLVNEPSTQTRFYVCFVKEPSFGKTAALNEVRNYMSAAVNAESEYVSLSSADSGPALVDAFVEAKEARVLNSIKGDQASATAPPYITFPRVLLDVDEMTDLFEKSKVTAQSKNSLFAEVLKLYEGNRTGNKTRKHGNIQLTDAYLAILGGATPEGYERMWTGTGGGATGLQSRFILVTTTQPRMGIKRRPSNSEALAPILARLGQMAKRGPVTVALDKEAEDMLVEWWGEGADKPSEVRIDDMIKRLLIVLAVTSETTMVGRDLMAQALAWGDYLIAVREKFNLADSYSYTQAFEDAIRKVWKNRDRSLTLRDVNRLVHPKRRPGGAGPFLQAWKNLIAIGDRSPTARTRRGESSTNWRLKTTECPIATHGLKNRRQTLATILATVVSLGGDT